MNADLTIDGRMLTLNRIFARMEIAPNGCHLWTGSKNSYGYGTMYFRGRSRILTRVIWEIYNGAIRGNHLRVCHSCDTPACVNINHLWIGTQADNVRDSIRKGRFVFNHLKYFNKNLKYYTVDGKTGYAAELARARGLKPTIVAGRMWRGWSIEEALLKGNGKSYGHQRAKRLRAASTT